ncbi:exopolysaccharide biosynthesis polyprenyl glycosylphosphotransferase [Candidatus Viridilinea mediisalina]|uniref:Glycosyl transferase n=1 Tax=Candidatus Viridilinea mediisalina TaxID=2024553 RepID=A0A2A6RM58_9CHLR|nr:exopolysaccharide biosynthesis polyprenyl glycosylphosphotransferase [Candidatus Viridilinea mediisalina]PDW04137.1 glycosyl transferase [Candidatus Viridilinea mediisalina]
MQEFTPRQLDPKAERMLAIFAEQRFRRSQSNQRLRARMLVWSIRTKVVRSLKRTLDVTVASAALVASAPLMAATALAIKLESPGPIIFRQIRVGKDGEHFYCYKFRSMYVDAEVRRAELLALNESDGPVFKIKRDPRITRVGRFIRKLSIDELPQLVNVLKGEMSLVGPRPAIPSEVERYTFDQIARLRAMPGITGLQQVSGRSNLDFKRWIELDLQYIAEQSIWKDLEILLKTVPAVLSSRGAY